MKRWILRVVVMLIAFVLGFGIDRLIWSRAVSSPSQAEVVKLAPATLEKEIVFIPAPPRPDPTPNSTFILDYDTEKFTPWGYFYILGSKPKEFAELDSIQLALVGPTQGDIGADPGWISVETRSGENYDRARATVAFATEKRLFFATLPTEQSGVEYWFDGEFLRTDFDAVAGKKKAALRGTLTKTKNGKKIAQRTLSFWMEHMGC